VAVPEQQKQLPTLLETCETYGARVDWRTEEYKPNVST